VEYWQYQGKEQFRAISNYYYESMFLQPQGKSNPRQTMQQNKCTRHDMKLDGIQEKTKRAPHAKSKLKTVDSTPIRIIQYNPPNLQPYT
jgi:hypothetical protein